MRGSVRINEGSTGKITGTIVDASEAGVAGDELTSATYTLYDYVTGAIINGRENIDVLNANGATISSSPGTEGYFVIPLSAADNVILNSSRPSEEHVALLKFTAPGVAGSSEIKFAVRNVKKIS
jgi:hypothetical protein